MRKAPHPPSLRGAKRRGNLGAAPKRLCGWLLDCFAALAMTITGVGAPQSMLNRHQVTPFDA